MVVSPATATFWSNVVIPATLTLSKLVCPSTSISEFKSILPEKVEIPVTANWSSTVTVPPAESIVRLPVDVSISLSFVIPIWILSIVAPPFASTKPVNVETPETLRLSSSVWPSTSKSAWASILVKNLVVVPVGKNVVIPAILTLSKFVCPSTSRSALPDIVVLLTILPVKSPTKDGAVTIPDTLTLPTELIPTPSWPASTFPPTWRVNRGSLVPIPTLPPVLKILVYPKPTSTSSHCDVGIPCKYLASP